MAVTITVAGIQHAAIGKKQGRIQDTTGKLWNVWEDKIDSFDAGQSYSITYDTNEFKGTKFDVIKTFTPTSGGGAVQAQTPQQAIRQVIQQASAPMQFTSKDEMIFVCGALNNALGNQNVNPMMLTGPDVIGLVEKFRMAWRNTLGKTQSNNTDMNDEIPQSFS